MCIPLAAAVIGSAIIGAGVSYVQGKKSQKQAKQAQNQNVAMAQQEAQRAEQQFNKMNQKQPGIASLWAKNRNAASGGMGSTFLTGTKGVPDLASLLGSGTNVLGA